MRNFDEVAWLPTPSIACGIADDLLHGHISGTSVTLGIATFQPSYALFRRVVVFFNDEPGLGDEDVVWRSLVTVLAEQEVYFLPSKYFVLPHAYDQIRREGAPYVDAAILLGRRPPDGASHSIWQILCDEAHAIITEASE